MEFDKSAATAYSCLFPILMKKMKLYYKVTYFIYKIQVLTQLGYKTIKLNGHTASFGKFSFQNLKVVKSKKFCVTC